MPDVQDWPTAVRRRKRAEAMLIDDPERRARALWALDELEKQMRLKQREEAYDAVLVLMTHAGRVARRVKRRLFGGGGCR